MFCGIFSFLSSEFCVLRSVLCVLCSAFWVLSSGCTTSPKVSSLNQVFASLPSSGPRQSPILPTDNEQILRGNIGQYAVRTAANESYGMPGWSRNNGTRFHEGVDIQPVSWTESKYKMKVACKDPVTGRLTSRLQNVRIPKDRIYAVLDGIVVITSTNPARSGYGKYVMIEHAWSDGTPFLTLYAHLSSIHVKEGQSVSQGALIGIMGQTAKDAASREYLRANPHMHFEVGRLIDPDGSSFGNKYDPRNMQPFQPIDFLERYNSISHREWAAKKSPRAPMLATVAAH